MTLHEPLANRGGDATTGAPRSVADLMSGLRSGAQQGGRSVAFATGFDPLDLVLEGGIRTHDLVLVGGAPGVGKTIATLQWARHVATTGQSAVYACYEHDELSLLARLLSMELGYLAAEGAEVTQEARRAIVAFTAGEVTLPQAMASQPILQAVHDRLEAYADRLWLSKVSGSRTTVDQLAALAAEHTAGEMILFVDYLQKVPVRPEPENEAEKVLRIAEGLKDLALTLGIAVVAVAAADHAGLEHRRLRLEHLRGSSALAYESDIVLMLNDKVDAVSKVHLAYDPVRAATFRQQVVFSLEKFRAGQAHLDVEFAKDFNHYRFDPRGAFVAERMSDDRLEVE